MSFRRRPVALAIALVMLAGCRGESTGPGYELAASTYLLTSVSGRGASSGILTLSADGQAVRRARYARADGSSSEYVARGSYRVGADGTLDLRLREDDGRSDYVWRPMARLAGGMVELRYPDPADGADIIETYRRL